MSVINSRRSTMKAMAHTPVHNEMKSRLADPVASFPPRNAIQRSRKLSCLYRMSGESK